MPHVIQGDDHYYSIIQILSYRKRLFWIQERFTDSFGQNPLGLFIVDEWDDVVRVEAPGLDGVHKTLDSFWGDDDD